MDYHSVQGTFERAIEDAYTEHALKADRLLASFLSGAHHAPGSPIPTDP